MTTRDGSSSGPWVIRLLGGFEARRDGELVEFPAGQQRLIAFVALNEGAANRAYLAGTLWPDTSDERAAANLRSTLWRLRVIGRDLLHLSGDTVGLHPTAVVDVRMAAALAYRLLADPGLADAEVTAFRGDLLPGWAEPWVQAASERFGQLRVHALEVRGARLVNDGRPAAAAELAAEAIVLDRGRESAHRLFRAATSILTGV